MKGLSGSQQMSNTMLLTLLHLHDIGCLGSHNIQVRAGQEKEETHRKNQPLGGIYSGFHVLQWPCKYSTYLQHSTRSS